MSVNKYFIRDNLQKNKIDIFLSEELTKAGYSHSEITKTPLGSRIVVYAAKPGLIIGRRGQSIRDLTRILEEKFNLENPQVSVAPIEVPELNAKVMSKQIAQALQRGIHFRRASYWALQRIMKAGAKGAEIAVSGKVSTRRARYEKYRDGYLPRVGDPVKKQMRIGLASVHLKPGIIGIKVSILPPDTKFPDQPLLKEIVLKEEKEEQRLEEKPNDAHPEEKRIKKNVGRREK